MSNTDIYQILDGAEMSAMYRRLWMKRLPTELGTLVRVALAARNMIHNITWHERNGGLPDNAPRLHEARETYETVYNKMHSSFTPSDESYFEECLALVDDLKHSGECAVCLSDSDMWMFRDATMWDLISA